MDTLALVLSGKLYLGRRERVLDGHRPGDSHFSSRLSDYLVVMDVHLDDRRYGTFSRVSISSLEVDDLLIECLSVRTIRRIFMDKTKRKERNNSD